MATSRSPRCARPNGSNSKQRETLRTLGLGRIGRTSERDDDPTVRGLIDKVSHLVKVEWLTRACTTSARPRARARTRKRVGRGEGSGTGKTSGRGHKGAGARSGASKRVRFEGGQNPIQMRMRKLRGPTMKKSMPFEKFRTRTQPVNLSDLEARFDKGAEVTPDSLREAGLATRRGVPVKVLGNGELTKELTVHAHGFSATAREKIEAAGGSASWSRASPCYGRSSTRSGSPTSARSSRSRRRCSRSTGPAPTSPRRGST